MSGLFSSLQTSSAALEAFSQALGASQTNISNSSTAGYAAIRATIQPIDLSGDGSSASDFVTLTSTGNAIADAQVRTASSQAAASQTSVEQLTPVNQLFDITGSSGILAALQEFSSAFSNLSVTPNDPTLGAQALSAAGDVASAIQSVASSLTTQSQQIDSSLQTTTQQINSLAGQIQELNVETTAATQFNPGIDASLRSDLTQLSSLVDITVNRTPMGRFRFWPEASCLWCWAISRIRSRSILARRRGRRSLHRPAAVRPPRSRDNWERCSVPAPRLASLLAPAGDAGSLNTLASGFASQVNSLLTSGVNASGVAGVPIFTFDPNNAAQSIAIDPTVTADQLGLATTGASPSTNGIANQLAALPSSTAVANQIGGESAEGFFSSIAASVGQQLSGAETASTADQTTLTSAQAGQQQQSGVSLDQEAVNITDYQRSYEASAQVVSILDQLTSDEVNMIDGTAL